MHGQSLEAGSHAVVGESYCKHSHMYHPAPEMMKKFDGVLHPPDVHNICAYADDSDLSTVGRNQGLWSTTLGRMPPCPHTFFRQGLSKLMDVREPMNLCNRLFGIFGNQDDTTGIPWYAVRQTFCIEAN